MKDKIQQELYTRVDGVALEINEPMTCEQLCYFLKGYEYCRMQMLDIVDDIIEDIYK